MNEAPLESGVRELLDAFPGVIGCALVEASSGLVWYRRPDNQFDGLWEASIDHWRLHGRLASHFDALGPLGAIVTYHQDATVALLPCVRDRDILLVCLAENNKVDWQRWQTEVRRLGARIRAAF